MVDGESLVAHEVDDLVVARTSGAGIALALRPARQRRRRRELADQLDAVEHGGDVRLALEKIRLNGRCGARVRRFDFDRAARFGPQLADGHRESGERVQTRIGAIGAVTGVVLGFVLCVIGNHYKLVSLPADVYSISNVPLIPKPGEMILAALVAFVLSLLATIYPARAASRLKPVEALRDS